MNRVYAGGIASFSSFLVIQLITHSITCGGYSAVAPPGHLNEIAHVIGLPVMGISFYRMCEPSDAGRGRGQNWEVCLKQADGEELSNRETSCRKARQDCARVHLQRSR